MIPQIREINFGPGTANSYATLHQASISFTEMGDRTISTQIRIDGDVVPDFTGWELEFRGERFVLPIRDPQAAKDNTSRNSIVDLVFQSWAPEQLKRYFFVSLASISAGVEIADKYNASVNLNLQDFVALFNRVLQYYFGNKIQMQLYPSGTYSPVPALVEINHTYIWDVLTKIYEIYGQRWVIEYDSANDIYYIKVGYPADEISDHDFEYGFDGGLLRFERQVQDNDIRNILLGRGGEKNLPYRYFKDVDPGNPEWAADPDAIPELANVYFDRLRDAAFRWYVRGWMQNPNRDTSWDASHQFPTYSTIPEEYQWAYDKGRTDTKFNPVEYAKDDGSIEKYGERWGALDDNDDIYPTIQGKTVQDLGRIDEVVAVSEIVSDDVDAAAHTAAVESNVGGTRTVTHDFQAHQTIVETYLGGRFSVPEGSYGTIETAVMNPTYQDGSLAPTFIWSWEIKARNTETDVEYPVASLAPGQYQLVFRFNCTNNSGSSRKAVTYGVKSVKLITSEIDENAWKPTFDVWVKNLWGSSQNAQETDEAYAARVWEPILGDRVGNEAKLVFSTGFMSISQDYEFVVAKYPVKDRTKMINGVPSEWRITLYKNDAELDSTGLFIPNATTGGKPAAGDKFFLIGIDMPFQYVEWGEEAIHDSKVQSLSGVSDINPTWLIKLDKIRVNTLADGEYGETLAERIKAGSLITITDPRFTGGVGLSLYVQSLTLTWNEPSEGGPSIVPDIEVVLSDKVAPSEGPISRLSNDVSTIRSAYVPYSDLDVAIRRVATPLFLKKTGESDTSDSPTTFASKLSSRNFTQGGVGGSGWGHYVDGDDSSVLEIDKLVVRQELSVNSLIVNQIAHSGGRSIVSAASIECIQVDETDDSYICSFDQKRGSVANLFRVGDIAMGQMFDPDNSEQRYYRALVTAVNDYSITLSKTQKDGAGVPQEGDIIVQYGNVSDASRQYVIVRDVIGGGYERMISGLNSVSASGSEYYFAGRQNGGGPRWFVGNANGEFAEYSNGVLNIKGTVAVKKTDGTYQSMADYITGIKTLTDSLQEQIDGAVQTWSGNEPPTLQNYPANAWTDTATRNNHLGDLYYDETTGHGYRFMYSQEDGFHWFQLTDEDVTLALSEAARANAGVAGLQYLKNALADGTTIVEGGLVLTNLIQLGQTENNVFMVYSGINGTLDQTLSDPTTSIAAWYGGEMLEKAAWDSMTPQQKAQHRYAKSLFRHDGSGYLASGNIYWTPTGSGGIPGITWNGNNITISGDVQLGSVSGDTVTSMLTLLRQINNWFEEDANGDVYVRRKTVNGQLVPRNFYSYGEVAAGGVGSGGGGGGGTIDLPRMWQALMNTAGPVPDNPNNLIAVAHIPDLTVSKISDIETWISSKGYLTEHQSLAGYVNELSNSGSGNYIASLSKVGKRLTAVYGTLPTSLPASDVYAWAKAATKPSYTLDEVTDGSSRKLSDYVTLGTQQTITARKTFSAGLNITDDAYIMGGLTIDGGSITLDMAVISYANGYLEFGGSSINFDDGIYFGREGHIGYEPDDEPMSVGYFTFNRNIRIGNETGFIKANGTIDNNTYNTSAQTNTAISNAIAALNLGTASQKDFTTSVSSGGTALPTAGAVYSAINAAISSAIKFQGVTTTALTDGSTTNPITIDGESYTANKGDEVIYGGLEFLWTGSKWQQLGDESSWARKSVTITGVGYLTGGGTLEANRTIDLSATTKTKVDNGATAYSWGNHASAGYFLTSNFTQANIKTTLGISDWALAGTKPSYTFAEIGATPTTLAGYGITDAVPSSRTVNGHALSADVTVTKGDVGLGNVENTKLSTWAGTANITTLGTIVTGTWHGSTIDNAYLTNSSITIGSTAVSLGGSITNLAGLGTIGASGRATLSGGISLGGQYNNQDSALVWDSTNHAWHLIGNFYADGFVSAGGIGVGGSGGGAVETLYRYADLGRTFDDNDNDTFNAYTINRINSDLGSRLNALEGGAAVSVVQSGSGNVVTGVTKSGTTITVTKATTLGAAATKNIGSVASGNIGLVTGGDVYSYVNSVLSSVLRWVGETTTDIVANPTANPITINGQPYTAVAGNIVAIAGTSREFRFDGTTWSEIGDESSYAYKTISITGTGYLTGGGTLEANRTIDIAQTYKTHIQHGQTAYGWGNHALAGYASQTTKVNNKPLSADITLTLDDVADGTSRKLSNYLARSGGSMLNTAIVQNLNADLLDGKHAYEIEGFDLYYDLSGEDVFLIGKPVPSPSDLEDAEADYGNGQEDVLALVTECFGKPGGIQTPKDVIEDAHLDYPSVREYIDDLSPETGAERWTREQHSIILGEVEYQLYSRDSFDPEVQGDVAAYGLVDAGISYEFLCRHTLRDNGDLWCPFTFILSEDYSHCYDCRVRSQAFRCLVYVED